jgi:hypothetical protein
MPIYKRFWRSHFTGFTKEQKAALQEAGLSLSEIDRAEKGLKAEAKEADVIQIRGASSSSEHTIAPSV